MSRVSSWGEFELHIRIYLVDTSEKPIELTHMLRLFPLDGQLSKKPVVSEFYDEIVFNEPTEQLYRVLKQQELPPLPSGRKVPAHPRSDTVCMCERASERARRRLLSHSNVRCVIDAAFHEQGELRRIQDAHKKVRADITKLTQQFDEIDSEIQRTEAQLRALRSSAGATTSTSTTMSSSSSSNAMVVV